MAGTRITIRVRGEAQAQARLNEIVNRLKKPEGGLIKATNKVAEVFAENYDREGSMVGGWPQLAEKTQNLREYYGYPREHPILIRYGALRAVAVEFFEEAKKPGRTSKNDDYSNQTTTGTLSISGDRAELQVSGWKVSNQYGFSHPNNPTDTPARPFWFIDRNSVAAAREGVKEWIEDEVLKR